MNPAEFAAEVELAATLYFTRVLPAFIERHFRGGGRAFLWQLLDAHDRRSFSAIDGVVPSEKAKKKALKARAQAPLQLVDGPIQFTGAVVLGLFNHSETFVRESMFATRSLGAVRGVMIFQGSFFSMGWDDAQLRQEIFWTIFHEYIHFFESFLLKKEQVLRAREEADQLVRQTSLDRARQLDRRHNVGRAVRWTLGLAVLAACLAVPLLSKGPQVRSEVPRIMMEKKAPPRAP